MTYPGMLYPGMYDPPLGYQQPDYYPKMWFGTFGHMEWIDTPRAGADVSPQGWNASGVLLNGGGYVVQSAGTHRNYAFEWKATSARAMAQKMQDYRNGVYAHWGYSGNTLYFVDPLTYNTNMLPSIWAHPAGVFNVDTHTHLTDYSHPFGTVEEVITPIGIRDQYKLPTRGVEVLDSLVKPAAETSFPTRNILYVPTPGYSLDSSAQTSMRIIFWMDGTFSSSAGMFYRRVYADGTLGGEHQFQTSSPGSLMHEATVFQTATNPEVGLLIYTKGSGFRVYGGRAVMLELKGKFVETINFEPGEGDVQWFGGQGHSGCKIENAPTYVNNNSVNGGQIGYAATLKEVGTWIR